jgi:AcrR family transcriptional regulator
VATSNAPDGPDGGRPRRADARRNYDRLVGQAKAAFLEHGTRASLEDIARRAGVGIGTLYRHFPSRTALIDAVFQEEADALLTLAGELSDSGEPFEALTTWLRAVLARHRTYRGVATALMEPAGETAAASPSGPSGAVRSEAARSEAVRSEATLASSRAPLHAAGGRLLERAQRAGEARAETGITDLMRLVSAIGLASERAPEDPQLAERLLLLAVNGLRPRG